MICPECRNNEVYRKEKGKNTFWCSNCNQYFINDNPENIEKEFIISFTEHLFYFLVLYAVLVLLFG